MGLVWYSHDLRAKHGLVRLESPALGLRVWMRLRRLQSESHETPMPLLTCRNLGTVPGGNRSDEHGRLGDAGSKEAMSAR